MHKIELQKKAWTFAEDNKKVILWAVVGAKKNGVAKDGFNYRWSER